MRVIEEKHWTEEVICNECGTKVELEEDDIQYRHYRGMMGGRGGAEDLYEWICPRVGCGERNEANPPRYVQKNAEIRRQEGH